MRQPVLILEQETYEPAALIASTLHAAGYQTQTRMTKKDPIPPTLDEYAGLIVMGGPMSAKDTHEPCIHTQISLLRWVIKHDVPMLGICLGAQLLAKAAGADIFPAPVRELGWHPLQSEPAAQTDPLFDTIADDVFSVFQWHGETFTLPKNAILLASCPEVRHQAFRLGTCQYGVQFHIEIDETIMDQWLSIGTNERAHLGTSGEQLLRHHTPVHLPAAHTFCRKMVNAWTKLLDCKSIRA